jgi:dihydrofolate reductase
MRRVVLLEHISLDGFMGSADGGLEWVRLDDELWDYVGPIIAACDTALYGRVTYGWMAEYWPSAADNPNATPHDIEHGKWTAQATKLVFSKTLEAAPWGANASATLVREDASDAVRRLKQEPGGDMIVLGSASVAHALIRAGLVDHYRLNVNPVILGSGVPMFPSTAQPPRTLELAGCHRFASGVLGLHYTA